MIEPLEKHSVFIMDKGGKQRIQEITDLTQVVWERTRDDISTAQVNVSANKDSAQADFLRSLVGATGRYEMCIWREGVREWEGPLLLPTFTKNGVTLAARDVMHYSERLIMKNAYSNAYPAVEYVSTRAANIMTAEFARLEALSPAVNVLPWMVNHHFSTDAMTSRSTLPFQYYVYEHIDDMAANAGMDYTVLGRAVHFWDTSQPVMGYTRTVTESDFFGEMYVSAYGMELGTYAAVTDGQGNYGETGGIDPYYGLVERLATAYDENATALPSLAELTSQAVRNLAGRNPTPLQVRVPDGSSVNMSGVLTMADLVPGIYVPMLAHFGIVKVSQMQKLNNVKVTETAQGEKVEVKFYPASDSDTVVS
jgi:hypothetical protein